MVFVCVCVCNMCMQLYVRKCVCVHKCVNVCVCVCTHAYVFVCGERSKGIHTDECRQVCLPSISFKQLSYPQSSSFY